MKVSVLGAGAIGSMLGGLLVRDATDLEVVLIVRGEQGRVMAERKTLVLDGPWGRREVPIQATSDPTAVAGSDFVFVTVKSQDTESAAAAAAPHWGDATIVSIQNGINDHRLTKFVEPHQLAMGMTATNIALAEPGRVSLQLGGATVVGPPVGEKSMESAIAAAKLLERIRSSSLKFLAHSNAIGVRYNKLAINSLGYSSCLSKSNFITEALTHPEWRQAVGLPLVRECDRVFSRAGIALERIPGLPNLSRLDRLMRRLNVPVLGSVIALGARRLFNRRPIIFSLQQDLERCKATEVDFVNGEIVRLAESVGEAVPRNALVVSLCHELESRHDGTFFSREEVIRRFGVLG